MQLTDEDFSHETFAMDDEEFPNAYPLSFAELRHEQQKDDELKQRVADTSSKYKYANYKHSD